MLLARLRVRQKLALLVLPLLVLIVVGAVPLVGDRFAAAASSTRTAETVQRAVRIGELVQELQQERVVSLGYLQLDVGRDDLVARSARVLDLTEQLAVDYGAGDDQLATALRTVSDRNALGGVRLQVLRKLVVGTAVHSAYTAAIQDLIDLLDLNTDADLGSPAGRQELALDAIIRRDESTAAAASALFITPDLKVGPQVVALVNAAISSEDQQERIFEPLGDPVAVRLYDNLDQGPSRLAVDQYLRLIVRDPVRALQTDIPPSLLQPAESLIDLGRLVETRIATEAVRLATASAQRDRLLAGLGVGLALVILLAAVILAFLISRSIARPLRRLTESADEVARTAQAELVRVADTEDGEVEAPRLRPVRVGTADELGELAEAFNRVQRVAADLVERQAVSRRNVATMFGNVGRRTQNLVGRQLAMIDSLERNEQDPALLERLYRLDHVSTRLRRNANSLVVLSGAAEQELTGEPMSVADAIRAALGEIEGFQRVRLADAEPALLTPHITPDVVLLLAELLENGTSFSPPHTEVEVGAAVLPAGDVRIRIVDHGLGMTPDQLAEENARLVERERLDLAPTDVLGLFVVGRLARRHGIRVRLLPTTGSGVTAEVVLPSRHVLREADAPVPVGGPAAASDRGWWEPVAPGRGPGIRRRVKGAQHPRTDPRPIPGDAGDAGGSARPAPEEARRAIEDFEQGVRRAQQESAGEPEPHRNGHARPVAATPLFLRPVPPDVTRAQVEEFEDGVRKALARLEELSPPKPSNGHAPAFFPGSPTPPRPTPAPAPPEPAPPQPEAAAPTEPMAAGPAEREAAAEPEVMTAPTAPEPAAELEAAAGPEAVAEPEAVDVGGVVPELAQAGDPPLARRRRPAGDAELPAAWRREPVPQPRDPAMDFFAASPPPPDDEGGPPVQGPLTELVRRVPGAQMPAGARGARPKPPPHEPLDADAPDDSAAVAAEAARAMVELFEAGVERALHTEHEPRRTTEEGGR